jgi:hypothetical protein
MQLTRKITFTIVISFLTVLASCGGGSNSGAAAPSLAELSGTWVPEQVGPTVQPAVITGEIGGMIISPDGFVTLLEVIQGLPNYREYFGYVMPDGARLAGTLDYVPIGLDANAEEPTPPGTVAIELDSFGTSQLSGEITFDDGTILSFNLTRGADLTDPPVDPDLVGSWTNAISSQTGRNPPLSALTFDDAGNGVGIYNDICLLEATLNGLAERIVPVAGGGTGPALLHRANVVATGCEGEGEFSGIAYLRWFNNIPIEMVFYLANDDRFFRLGLLSEAWFPVENN